MGTRIVGRNGVYHLRLWHEAANDTEGELLDLRGKPEAAAATARAVTQSSGGFGAARKLLSEGGRGIQRLSDAEVLAELGRQLEKGHLLAIRLPVPALFAFDLLQGEEPEATSTPLPKTEPKTWIEIELVDTEGKPVPGERYWIQLPDGRIREGRLDASGKAYFGELEAGECDVRFPDLDEEAVLAPGEPAKPKTAPIPKKERKTWVEIELVGMDGNAVANQMYRINLPDGTAVEGRLNERGRARVTGIDPGTCVVTFPDLDMEAWEPLAP